MKKIVQLTFPANARGLKLHDCSLDLFVAERGGFESGSGTLVTSSIVVDREKGTMKFEDLNLLKRLEGSSGSLTINLYVDDNIEEYRIVNGCKYCEKTGESVSASGSFD